MTKKWVIKRVNLTKRWKMRETHRKRKVYYYYILLFNILDDAKSQNNAG